MKTIQEMNLASEYPTEHTEELSQAEVAECPSSMSSEMVSKSLTSMSFHSCSSPSSHAQMSSDVDVFADDHLPGSEQLPCRVHTLPTLKLVSDNLDKSVCPRDMQIDCQTQALHVFFSQVSCVQLYQWPTSQTTHLSLSFPFQSENHPSNLKTRKCFKRISLVPRPRIRREKWPGIHCLRMRERFRKFSVNKSEYGQVTHGCYVEK